MSISDWISRSTTPRDEMRAFLPAALELVETPASPLPRLVGALIIGIFVIAIIWASLGFVDVIATAPGKIIPSGRAKTIQPLEVSSVKAIYVEEGQHVKAGQILIALDPTNSQADQSRVSHDLELAKLDVARLNGLLHGSTHSYSQLGSGDEAMRTTSRAQLLAQRQERQAKLDTIDRQLQQKRAEYDAGSAVIAKLNNSLPLSAKRVQLREDLQRIGYGNKLAVIDSQQQLVEQQNEVRVQRHHLEESNAGISALQRERAEVDATYQQGALAELAKAETQVRDLSEELRKAVGKTNLQRITAPVDGVVTQLAVHTIGGVVTPAQSLMEIVPSNVPIEVEAVIENKDIGFIAAGQPVAIKIEAFSFTRYGLVYGRVSRVSYDAVSLDQVARGPAALAASEIQTPQRLGYVVRITLNKPDIEIDGKHIPLTSGMAVTAEIKTARQRLIDYILSPLKTSAHDSFQER